MELVFETEVIKLGPIAPLGALSNPKQHWLMIY
jgi:hypothetical protein